MVKESRFLWILLLVISLLLVGCASNLSDVEFAESAQGACQALSQTFETLDQLNYEGKAEAYGVAAAVLGELNITEESAPQGFLLQKNLSELADTQKQFADALDQAIEEAGMDQVLLMMTTEGGDVYGSASGNILDMTKLNIDNALVTEMTDKIATIEEAATSLGLESCAPEKLGE